MFFVFSKKKKTIYTNYPTYGIITKRRSSVKYIVDRNF